MDLKLPDIGEGVHEGEVVKWLVKEGDSVNVDQPIVEVMTDKATVEIPTPTAGTISKLHAKPGDIIKVGQVIVTFAGSSAKVAEAPKQATPPPPPPPPQMAAKAVASAKPAVVPPPRPTAMAQVSQAQSAPLAEPGNALATPATRRLARDLGVDLSRVSGSGPHGRVTKEDVQQFVGATAAGPQVPVLAPSRIAQALSGQAETLVPFRGIRRKISEAMTRSRQTIPDFTYVDECDISELVAFRKEAKALAEKQGVKLTYMPFICKAAIRGLREFPYLNSVLDEQGGNIVLKNYFNVGIAVDTEDGLIVPVIKNADQKSILQLAKEMQDLAEKARSRKLALDDLQGGTFTITNAGNIGGLLATPVINWPEVAIMGVHKISKRPIVKNDQIIIADTIWLSVAVDHRVVDGAMAARFMNVVIEYLSNPKKMMLEMA